MNRKNEAPTSQQVQQQKPIKALRLNVSAKIVNPSELRKGELTILEFFNNVVGTTLDCFLSTGILRNTITYKVDELEKRGMLGVVKVAPDKNTGHKAKWYSTHKNLWLCNNHDSQLSFKFREDQ